MTLKPPDPSFTPEAGTISLSSELEVHVPTGTAVTLDGGLKAYRDTFGTYDDAVAASFVGNRSDDPTTQVMGTTDVSAITERGSVTVFADNTANAPTVDSTSTTFTASTVTFGGAVSLVHVVAGMIVDIAGNEHVGGETAVGVVQSVSGQTVTLTSAGWKVGGIAASTPSASARARINRANKVWGLNVAVRSTTAEGSVLAGTSLTGIEVDIETDYDHGSTGFSGPTGLHAFGVDVYRNTVYSGRGLMAYSARGQHVYGYGSSGIYTGGAHFIAHANYEKTVGVDAAVAFYDDDSKATISFKSRRALSTDLAIAVFLGTEANSRVALKPNGIEFGPGGAGALDYWLRRLSTNVLGVSGKFTAVAGFGTGNSVAATEVIGKAVVKKIEVWDAAGASLGFIPVYSSIT